MNIQNMKITDIRPYEKNPRPNEGDADQSTVRISRQLAGATQIPRHGVRAQQ